MTRATFRAFKFSIAEYWSIGEVSQSRVCANDSIFVPQRCANFRKLAAMFSYRRRLFIFATIYIYVMRVIRDVKMSLSFYTEILFIVTLTELYLSLFYMTLSAFFIIGI